MSMYWLWIPRGPLDRTKWNVEERVVLKVERSMGQGNEPLWVLGGWLAGFFALAWLV